MFVVLLVPWRNHDVSQLSILMITFVAWLVCSLGWHTGHHARSVTCGRYSGKSSCNLTILPYLLPNPNLIALRVQQKCVPTSAGTRLCYSLISEQDGVIQATMRYTCLSPVTWLAVRMWWVALFSFLWLLFLGTCCCASVLFFPFVQATSSGVPHLLLINSGPPSHSLSLNHRGKSW